MALAESAFFLLLALKIFAILYKVNGRRFIDEFNWFYWFYFLNEVLDGRPGWRNLGLNFRFECNENGFH